MSLVGRNLVFLLISQLATWSVTLIALVVAPNELGAQNLGKIGFAIAFVQFFGMAATLGTPVYLVRAVARDHSLLGRYVVNAAVVKLLMAAVFAGIAVLVAWSIGIDGDALAVVAITSAAMFVTVVNEVFVAAQNALQRMGRPAMWGVVQTYIASLGGVLILLAGGSIVMFSAAPLVAAVVALTANVIRVWPWTAGDRRLDFSLWAQISRGGLPLTVLGALTLMYSTIDVPILNRIAGESAVGWYALAYRFVAIPLFIATAACNAYFPSFSALGLSGSGEFHRLVNRALRLVAQVSVPAAAGLAVVAPDLLRFIYGDEYENSIVPLQILALHVPLSAMGVVLGTALVASDRQRGYLLVAGIAAVLNPFICVAAIHWSIDRFGNGAIGAAIATVATEVVVFSGALRLRAKGVMDSATAWFSVRVVMAATVMGGVVLSLGRLPSAFAIPVGIAAYVAASFLVRTITPADVRLRAGGCALGDLLGLPPSAPERTARRHQHRTGHRRRPRDRPSDPV